MASVFLVLILIHLLPFIFPAQYLWGADSWYYFDPVLVIIFVVISCTSIFLIIKKYDYKRSEKYLANKYLLYSLPIVFTLLFIFLSQSNYFLGDGYLRLRNLEAGLKFSTAEPFDTYIHSIALQYTNEIIGFSGADVYKWISIIAGFLSISGIVYYSKKLFDNSKAVMFTFMIMTFYSSQIFYGYVESYALVLMFLILFQLSLIRMNRIGSPNYLPIIFFCTAFLMHPVSFIFLPQLLWSYRNNIRLVVTSLISLIVSFALIILLAELTGYGFDKILNSLGTGNHLLPLFNNQESYGIISFGHLFDIINFLLMFSPILILSFIIGIKKIFSKGILVSITFPTLFLLAFKPELGFARDWDLFSISILPLLIHILYHFLNSDSSKSRQLVIPVMIMSFVHFLPWAVLNSSDGMSLSRAENLAETSYWSKKATARLSDELMQYHFDKGNNKKAAYFGEKSYENDKNERILYSLGTIEYSNGNYNKAELFFEELLPTGYKKPAVLIHLGELTLKQEKFSSSLKYFNEALKFNPEKIELKYNLAYSYFKLNNFQKAKVLFLEILVKQPKHEDALNNLGEIYFMEENYADAIIIYNELISLNPDEAAHYYNISLIYANMNKIDLALEYAQKAQDKGFNYDMTNELIRTLSGMK